jgi:hypothetical protein
MENRKYQSKLLGVIYEEALANFEVGAISEERLREYARDCLVPSVPKVSTQKPAAPVSRVPTQKPAVAARSGVSLYARSK